MPSPETIKRAKRAAKTKRRSEDEYRAALVAAHKDGHDMAVIARATGITRQGVRDLLLREQANAQRNGRSAAPE